MKIWRGDQDSSNLRQIRTSLPNCDGLFTNMINSGNPFALSQNGFTQSIQNHVAPGWTTSHFLSFSKNYSRAEVFAVGRSGKTLSLSNSTQWDTVIIEIDLAKLTFIGSPITGFEQYQFKEITLQQTLFPQNFMQTIAFSFAIKNRRAMGIPRIKNLLVIDVYQHLRHLAATGVSIDPMALTLSQQDEEILILPTDPLWGSAGNTALIDMGCISALEFFRLI